MFHQYAELLTSEDRQGRGVTGTEQRLKSREHEPVEATSKVTSGVQTHGRHTLLESAHHVGGISVFIYLFAKVCAGGMCGPVPLTCFKLVDGWEGIKTIKTFFHTQS